MRAANRAEHEASDEADDNGRRKDAAGRARRLGKSKGKMPVVKPVDAPQLDRVVDAPLVPPAPRGGILEVFHQPYLLRLIVSRQMASMYAASLLGLMWSYIQPALRFVVYYLVMGFILKLHVGTPYFAIHLFCGIVFVHYFSQTWAGGTRSIWQNKALVKKMRMPREIFPVASMLVAAYHTFPQLLVLVLACLLAGWQVSVSGLAAALLGMSILTVFSLAMGLLFSALNVFFRDFQNIVGTVLQFMHFLVPMMYPFSRIAAAAEGHPVAYQLYMANPVAEAVLLMQRFFWWGVIPEHQRHGDHLVLDGNRTLEFPPDLWERGVIMLVLSMLLLYLAQRFFTRVEGRFPERM